MSCIRERKKKRIIKICSNRTSRSSQRTSRKTEKIFRTNSFRKKNRTV